MMQIVASGRRPVFIDLTHDRFGSYPKQIGHFLGMNLSASRQFVKDAPVRRAWFENHAFRPMAGLCVDGRVQDFSEAIGLPAGVLEVFRSGGATINCRSISFCKRVLESVRRANDRGISAISTPMISMFMCVAHYSHSHPHDASCAAWDHQTKLALQAMQKNADQLNRSFAQDVLQGTLRRLVAFPVIVDTDLDAIIIFGPQGHISVRDLIESWPDQQDEVAFLPQIGARLKQIFPEEWRPFAELTPQMRAFFYDDLSELILANIAFVRNVFATERPIEILVHQERLVFVGRHADWNTEHNAVFLIDDDNHRLKKDFAIATRYVAKNALLDAVENNDRDWVVPVVVNVPHDGDDRLLTEEYVRQILLDLKAYLPQVVPDVVKWLLSPNGLGDYDLPAWAQIDIENLEKRVLIQASVSDRSTRLFVPISEN